MIWYIHYTSMISTQGIRKGGVSRRAHYNRLQRRPEDGYIRGQELGITFYNVKEQLS